jgi:hypothetical protein
MQKSAAGKFHFEPPFTSFDHLVGACEYELPQRPVTMRSSGERRAAVRARIEVVFCASRIAFTRSELG